MSKNSTDLNISIVAVGDMYVKFARNLIDDIRKLNNIKFYLLTDQRQLFENLKNIDIIDFDKPVISYHDQIIVAKKALSENDCTLLIDADHSFSSETIINATCESFECGYYPTVYFTKDEYSFSMNSFLKGNNANVPYGKEFADFCNEHGYVTEGVKHFQESFIIIKETDKEKKKQFFDAWQNLSDFCNNMSQKQGAKILGAGEGYSLSVAFNHANIKIKNSKTYRKLLSGFKHLRYEKFKEDGLGKTLI